MKYMIDYLSLRPKNPLEIVDGKIIKILNIQEQDDRFEYCIECLIEYENEYKLKKGDLDETNNY